MLVHEHGITIRIDEHETCRASRGLIRFLGECHPFRLELPLQFTNIGELRQWLGVLIPAGIESECVPLEHSLEESDDVIAILHDEPVLGTISAELGEAELFVERPGRMDILDAQADGKRTQFHVRTRDEVEDCIRNNLP